MIVQCDQCNAKFKLDDSKLKEGGVKVRCSKCKNIFTVRTEQPAEDSDFDSLLSGLTQPSPGTAEASGGSASQEVTSAAPATSVAGAEKSGEVSTEEPDKSNDATSQDDFDLSEFTFNQNGFAASPASPPGQGALEKDESDSVFGELDLGGAPLSDTTQDPSGQRTDTTISQEFEFKDEAPAPPMPEFELDVEGLGMFGEPVTPEAASPPETNSAFSLPAPEEFSFESETAAQKSPPDEENFFADDSPVFPVMADDAIKSPPAETEEKSDSGQPVPFDFSDFDFGDGAAKEKAEVVQQQPLSSGAEAGEAPAYSQISAPPLPDMPDMQSFDEEESPPLSISTRRKGGSGLPVAVIALSVLLVLALVGGGLYIFRQGPSAFNKLGLGLFGSVNKEEGGVLLRNTVGTFLNNKEAGEVFAINGEAVNNFGKPRASVQVKATLYGPKGAVLLQKTAYCGNNLSREQLTSLPAAKLDAAMNNQFGDSLSNLALQPGKAIPFVIVLGNVPKEVVEFGVEIVGSTVASQ